MSDTTFPLFPTFAFLGFILPLVPLSWHLQAWNSGTCYYMLWASLACLNQFVNSIVWHGNALNPAPIWCDISTRIMLGASVGLPAASLCINRRLYKISRIAAVGTTIEEKRRAVLGDTLICVVGPIIFIILQYIVQGHRFNIYEDIGCYPVLFNSIPTYFLSSMWPVVIGTVSAVYCVLTLKAFLRRRLEFNQLISHTKGLTVSRYFRLMALSITEMMFTIPLGVFTIWLSASTTTVEKWVSWDDTHFDYSRMDQYPSVIWRMNHLLVVSFEVTRWSAPFCSLVFFLFFGFADEAQRNYHLVYLGILKFLRLERLEPAPTSIKKGPTSWKSPSHILPKSSGTLSTDLPPYSSAGSNNYSISPFINVDIEKSVEFSVSSPISSVSPGYYTHCGNDVCRPSVSSTISHTSDDDPDVSEAPGLRTLIPTPSFSSSFRNYNVSLASHHYTTSEDHVSLSDYHISISDEFHTLPSAVTSPSSVSRHLSAPSPVESCDRIYSPDIETPIPRAPSPTPLSNSTPTVSFHRPFSPPHRYISTVQPRVQERRLTDSVIATSTAQIRLEGDE